MVARLLRGPVCNVAAVAERRLLCLLAATQGDRKVLGRRIADRSVGGAAVRAIAIGLFLAAPAGAPDHHFAGSDPRPVGPVGPVKPVKPVAPKSTMSWGRCPDRDEEAMRRQVSGPEGLRAESERCGRWPGTDNISSLLP